MSNYDRELFAKRNREGILVIYRNKKRMLLSYDTGSQHVYELKNSPEYVFALTSNWATTGQRRFWGGEPVLKKLKEIDLAHRADLFLEMEAKEKALEESKERDLKNSNEAWLSDNHGHFKKAFSGIRTANFDKSEKKRRLFEQRN